MPPARVSFLDRILAFLVPGYDRRRNKAVVMQMLEAFNAQKPDTVQKLFHPQYREDPAFPGFPLDRTLESVPPPQRVQQEIKLVREAFPDMRYSVKELVAEGDTVILIWEFTGTQRGAFFGREPTGKKTSVIGFEVVKFQNGRMISHYDNHAQTSVEVLGQLDLLDDQTLRSLVHG
jgi:hypothetical protein